MVNRDLRVQSRHLLPFDDNLTAVNGIHSIKELHHRGFSGSVLADQRMDLALFQGELSILYRLDLSKGLDDIPHLNYIFTHLLTLS